MFNIEKNSHVVELVIEFNLTAISKWLDSNCKIVDIEQIEYNYKNTIIQSYYIDVLPNRPYNNMYFHRNKGVVSNNVGGIDHLENVNKDIKQFIKQSASKIQIIEWGYWFEYLFLHVNGKPILLVPIEEFQILQNGGILKNQSKKLGREKRLIEVPVSFKKDGTATEHIQIWRNSSSSKSVGYNNTLGSVAASTLSFEVEY